MQSWQFQGDLLTHTGGDWEQGLGHYMQCKYIYVCFSLTPPLGLFLIMFSIISMDFFGLEAVESGYLMSYFGVLQMVSEVEVRLLPHHYLNYYLFDTCSSKSRCNIDSQILRAVLGCKTRSNSTFTLFLVMGRNQSKESSESFLSPVSLCRSLSCGAKISLHWQIVLIFVTKLTLKLKCLD